MTAVRGAAAGIVGLSAVINIFLLSGSLFMLQVYDRVLASGSVPTLVVLTGLVSGIYLFLGLLEAVRARLLARIAERVEEVLVPATLSAALSLPLRGITGGVGSEPSRPMHDLDRVRAFLGSPGPAALADLPWTPVYLFLAFLFHVDLGFLALAGVVVLIVITALNEWRTRAPSAGAAKAASRRALLVEAGIRNAEAVAALGMCGAFAARFAGEQADQVAAVRRGADVAALFGGLTKAIRLLMQSASLALGAYLALAGEITSGTIIAVSIITSRSMSPIEQAIGQWRGFVAARQSWGRLNEILLRIGEAEARTVLPPPSNTLHVGGLAVASPGRNGAILLRDVSFRAGAGTAVGVIGPSGAGKSTLARALVGIWPPVRGEIRLDGADLSQWDPEVLGRHLGYLPQGVELFDGTIAENIARLAADPEPGAVLAAARQASAHEMILRLPKGYDTPVGPAGVALSAGQRQRIGLARAFYRDPFLIVLDEPNANLDAEGDEALARAIRNAKERGAIVVVVAHRPSALAACDQVLVIAEGRQTAFGPKEEVLKKATLQPLRPVAS